MRMVFVMYEGMTALDAVGPHEVLSHVPGADVTWAAVRRGPVGTDTGNLTLHAEKAFADCDQPDLVLVPGGPNVREQLADEALRGWLREVDPYTTWTTSVCTGSLILGAAGLLRDRNATSHWLTLDVLATYRAKPTNERVVRDGKYVTAAGVSAGIDLALTLAAEIAGPETAQTIQLAIEYDPEPPFDAGSPAKAPAHLVRMLRSHGL